MFQGVLQKMITEMASPIRYYMQLNDDFLSINQLINHKLQIQFSHFQCMNCGADQPLFRQGFCKKCFFEAPQTADWVMRPELSKAHLNIEERDLAYEKQMQLQPHCVYLANSSHVKVGVTRASQVPTRWIDQGAHQALIIAQVPNRYLAGITEVALKQHVSDKTNWRKMLSESLDAVDLQQVKAQLTPLVPSEITPYLTPSEQVVHLQFPVVKYPEKVQSLNLLNTPTYAGVLAGVKGQYLIFEDGTVFNVRANEGLVVRLTLLN